MGSWWGRLADDKARSWILAKVARRLVTPKQRFDIPPQQLVADALGGKVCRLLRLFAIEGVKTIDEAIRSGLKVHAIVVSDSGAARAEHLLPQIPKQAETIVETRCSVGCSGPGSTSSWVSSAWGSAPAGRASRQPSTNDGSSTSTWIGAAGSIFMLACWIDSDSSVRPPA